MAPEIFSGNSYSFSADYFSAGAVLYELMMLSPVETKAVLSKTVSINPSLGYSQWLVDLVFKLLSVDPAQRPTPQAVLSNPALPMALLQGSIAELSTTVSQQNVRVANLEKTVAQQKEHIAVLESTVARQQERITALETTPVAQPLLPITAGSAAQALDSLQVEVEGVLRSFVRRIPHLKSANDQGYTVTCSSQYEDTYHACYLPFSGRSERWATMQDDVCNSWIEIALPKSERFNVLVLRSRWDNCLEQSPTVFGVCGLRATTWCDLGVPFVVKWEALNEEKHLYFANNDAFDKYRIKFQRNQQGTDVERTSGYIAVSLIDFGLVTE